MSLFFPQKETEREMLIRECKEQTNLKAGWIQCRQEKERCRQRDEECRQKE